MTGGEPLRKVRRGLTGESTPNGQKVDNSFSTLQKLFQLYSNADLCDVQLQVGNNVFHAHKLILSMSSDVFKTMLTDAKWPDARKTRIVLNEELECVQVFSEFLQYMYTGSIHLSNLSVLPVLTLADKYNIHDLSNVCKQYMADHCHTDPASLKVVSWLQYAYLCGDLDLESKLRRYVELNFDHVMQSEDFLTMQSTMLERLLLCEHLVIHSEFTLFLGLKKWLLHNGESCRSNRGALERKLVHQLMTHVRLPLMKQSQLLSLASDPLVCHHKEFFLPKIATAWAFQSCCPNASFRHSFGANHDQSVLTTIVQHVASSLRNGCEDSRVHEVGAGVSSIGFDNVENSTVSYDSDSAPSCHVSGSPASSNSCHKSHETSYCTHKQDDPETASSSQQRQGGDKISVFNSLTPVGPFGPWPTGTSRSQRVYPSVAIATSSLSSRVFCEKELVPHRSKQHSSSSDGVCAHLQSFSNLTLSVPRSVLTGSSRGLVNSFTPRNYTCDDWSTCLAIEDFANFPQYSSHTYFFSTPAGPLPSPNAREAHGDDDTDDEGDDSTVFEWQVELYPKGVRFPHAVMIGIPNNYDIDEHCQDVVRLAVMSKTKHEQPCRVDISVLAVAAGLEDGSEYMEALAHKSCIFDRDRTIHNIDSIVPYFDLNQAETKYLTSSKASREERTCFKMIVIIRPS